MLTVLSVLLTIIVGLVSTVFGISVGSLKDADASIKAYAEAQNTETRVIANKALENTEEHSKDISKLETQMADINANMSWLRRALETNGIKPK